MRKDEKGEPAGSSARASASPQQQDHRCEPIEGESLEPGWGCCRCKLYNGQQRTTCRGCGHERCEQVDERGKMLAARTLNCKAHGRTPWNGEIVCGHCGRLFAAALHFAPAFCPCRVQLMPCGRGDTGYSARAICSLCAASRLVRPLRHLAERPRVEHLPRFRAPGAASAAAGVPPCHCTKNFPCIAVDGYHREECPLTEAKREAHQHRTAKFLIQALAFGALLEAPVGARAIAFEDFLWRYP